MEDKEYCRIITSFTGEEIDNPKQIKVHNFDGDELREFVDFVEGQVRNSIIRDIYGGSA